MYSAAGLIQPGFRARMGQAQPALLDHLGRQGAGLEEARAPQPDVDADGGGGGTTTAGAAARAPSPALGAATAPSSSSLSLSLSLPPGIPAPLTVGSRVTAIHPVTRSLAEGVVLTAGATATGAAARLAQLGVGGAFGAALGASSLGSFGAGARCRVQFDREELGVHPVRDVDVALVPAERQHWPEESGLAGVFVPGLTAAVTTMTKDASAAANDESGTDLDGESEGEEEEEEDEEPDAALVEEAWGRAWAEAAARVRAVAKEALEEEQEDDGEGEKPPPPKRKSARKSSAGGGGASAAASASAASPAAPASAASPAAPAASSPSPSPSPLSPGEAERLACLVTKCSAVLSAMQGAAEAVAAAAASSSSAPAASATATAKPKTTTPSSSLSVPTAVAAFDRAVRALCSSTDGDDGGGEDDSKNDNREVYGRCAELLAQARALIRPGGRK